MVEFEQENFSHRGWRKIFVFTKDSDIICVVPPWVSTTYLLGECVLVDETFCKVSLNTAICLLGILSVFQKCVFHSRWLCLCLCVWFPLPFLLLLLLFRGWEIKRRHTLSATGSQLAHTWCMVHGAHSSRHTAARVDTHIHTHWNMNRANKHMSGQS